MRTTRPENPYPEGTIICTIMEGSLQEVFDGLPGWADMTTQQIAECLDTNSGTIRNAMRKIRARTGFAVPYTKMKAGRPPEV